MSGSTKPRREDLKEGEVLCEHCTAKCCRYFALPIEAPESYKDVRQVVQTCHDAGISEKCVKLRPIAVVKG